MVIKESVNEIPLIYVENNHLINAIPSEKPKYLYLLDLGGWRNNEPSLELYQRLSSDFSLWIDSSPARFEDVMDIVIAGANRITIKEDAYREETKQIFDEIDIEKFIGIELKDFNSEPSSDWDGIVIYISHQPDFKEQEFLASLSSGFPVHLLLKEKDLLDVGWAEEKGIRSVII